ncbi:DinB family protein [Streptomyces ficellus]|uniref:DinB family protein n=1 Tax=Streptomyces ficellus TaxID=1977088 RepID=A0ABT7ZA32_9ACTN|nr:DinB family protein [Streptomyces ficellus]MDN3296347.1 DinB family protein [Streptomyces ficellus]
MNSAGLLADAFGRVREVVHETVAGLSPALLHARLDPRANTIAWLAWHLTRIQDDHIADVADEEQLWLSAGWADRFALPFPEAATGYGHTSKQVAAVKVESADLLLGYYDAVHDRTVHFVRGLRNVDLDRVVDESWSPPVTLGVRLVSVVAEECACGGSWL